MHQFGAKVEVLVLPVDQAVCAHAHWYLPWLLDSGTSNHWVLVQGHILVTHEVVFPYDAHDVLVGNDMSTVVTPAVVNPLAKVANMDTTYHPKEQ